MAGYNQVVALMLLVTASIASTSQTITFNPTTTAWSTGLFRDSDLQQAQSCWSDYSSHWMANVRPCLETTSLCGPTTTTTQIEAFPQTTTLYPTGNVSTYKLCDGTPRANLTVETSTYTSYYTLNGISQLASDGKPFPDHCKPGQAECGLYHFGSNLQLLSDDVLDSRILLSACGQPLDLPFPCLIQGGPARLIYFPVTTADGDLCKGNGSTLTVTDSPTVVSTLGTQFTSGTAYISFETLYAAFEPASADKAGALQVGPTFSNAIFPFASSEISTNCFYGGPLLNPTDSHPGYGPGTQLNFADLNSPVPASAYKCANRCLQPHEWGSVNGKWTFTYASASACSTIWDNFNPLLAVPTRLREIAPEWEKCKFWHYRQPNIIFDPPIAVKPAVYEATPTLPSISGHGTPSHASPSPTMPPAMATVTVLPDVIGSSKAVQQSTAIAATSPAGDSFSPASTVHVHPVDGNQYEVDGIPLTIEQTLTRGNAVFHAQATGIAVRPSVGRASDSDAASASDDTVTVLYYGNGSDTFVATLLPAGYGAIIENTTLSPGRAPKTLQGIVLSVASDGVSILSIESKSTPAPPRTATTDTYSQGKTIQTAASSTNPAASLHETAIIALVLAFLGSTFIT